MIFYSRENGRDGEKDYIDTNDFKDVYFEKEELIYIKNGSEFRSAIDFELEYIPNNNAVALVGKIKDGNYAINSSINVDPVAIVEQGAEAYYAEELLDNIAVIQDAKVKACNELKDRLIADDCLLKGTNIDMLGLVVNNGNTIAVLDNITIVDNTKVVAGKFYSVVNIDTIMAGTVTMFLSDEKVLTGDINSIITRDDKLEIILNNMQTKDNTLGIEYKRSSEFDNLEEYHEDRAKFISIETTTEADFDEFDELF